eukprot:8222821-Lingulodinium_polyedra.AAC.1
MSQVSCGSLLRQLLRQGPELRVVEKTAQQELIAFARNAHVNVIVGCTLWWSGVVHLIVNSRPNHAWFVRREASSCLCLLPFVHGSVRNLLT